MPDFSNQIRNAPLPEEVLIPEEAASDDDRSRSLEDKKWTSQQKDREREEDRGAARVQAEILEKLCAQASANGAECTSAEYVRSPNWGDQSAGVTDVTFPPGYVYTPGVTEIEFPPPPGTGLAGGGVSELEFLPGGINPSKFEPLSEETVRPEDALNAIVAESEPAPASAAEPPPLGVMSPLNMPAAPASGAFPPDLGQSPLPPDLTSGAPDEPKETKWGQVKQGFHDFKQAGREDVRDAAEILRGRRDEILKTPGIAEIVEQPLSVAEEVKRGQHLRENWQNMRDGEPGSALRAAAGAIDEAPVREDMKRNAGTVLNFNADLGPVWSAASGDESVGRVVDDSVLTFFKRPTRVDEALAAAHTKIESFQSTYDKTVDLLKNVRAQGRTGVQEVRRFFKRSKDTQ